MKINLKFCKKIYREIIRGLSSLLINHQSYLINWLLQSFSQDYNLAFLNTHVVCQFYICTYVWVAGPTSRFRTKDFLRSFPWQFYSFSEILPEIWWDGLNRGLMSYRPKHYLLDYGVVLINLFKCSLVSSRILDPLFCQVVAAHNNPIKRTKNVLGIKTGSSVGFLDERLWSNSRLNHLEQTSQHISGKYSGSKWPWKVSEIRYSVSTLKYKYHHSWITIYTDNTNGVKKWVVVPSNWLQWSIK